MDTTAIISLIKEYGWQAIVIALAALLLIEVFKPLIRKVIAKEAARHAFYSLFDILLVAAGTYALIASLYSTWSIDWEMFGYISSAAYAALKIMYPMYSNFGLQAKVKALFSLIFNSRKEVIEAAKVSDTVVIAKTNGVSESIATESKKDVVEL